MVLRHNNLIQWDPFEVIYRVDDDAEEAYLITEGDAKILSKEGTLLGVVKSQSILGEFALINKCKRTVSAIAGSKGLKAKVVLSSKFDGILRADSLDRFLLLQTQERLVAADKLIAETSLQLEKLSGDARSLAYKKVLEGAKYSEVRHELSDLASKLRKLSSNNIDPSGQQISDGSSKHTFKKIIDKSDFDNIASSHTKELLSKLEPDDWIEINDPYRIFGILKRSQKLKLELDFLEFLMQEINARVVTVDTERQLMAIALTCEPALFQTIEKEVFISPAIFLDDRYYHFTCKFHSDPEFYEAAKSSNNLVNEKLIILKIPSIAKVYRQFEHRRFKLPERQIYDSAHVLVSDELDFTAQLLEVSIGGGFICLQHTEEVKLDHGMQLGLSINYSDGELLVDTYIKNVLSNTFSDVIFIEFVFISEEQVLINEIRKFVGYVERMLIIDEKSVSS